MNASLAPPSPAQRRAWMAVLARTPRVELEAALNAALEGESLPPVDWLRRPEIGLAMVRGRIGGSGDAFNLGEATVTRATLRLHEAAPEAAGESTREASQEVSRETARQAAPRGEPVIGVACHLGRDKRRAELAALADALLQLPGRHARLHTQLIEPLAARLAAARAERRRDTASTRVEFFTMVRGE